MIISAENRPQVKVCRQILQEPGDRWQTPYLTSEEIRDRQGRVIGTELVEVVSERDLAHTSSIPMPYDGPGDDLR